MRQIWTDHLTSKVSVIMLAVTPNNVLSRKARLRKVDDCV